MNSMKKFLAITLIAIARYINRIQNTLISLSDKVYVPGNTVNQSTLEIVEQLSNDPEDFKKFALELSESLSEKDQELKEAAYLYFLTKQAASIYEAKIKYLPLQVYNEMRNSLDHYFRAIIVTAGSRYFCESLFWASQPKQAAKT